ncbi:MAG: methyltransferase domain-containing protein [Verrucomicrobia bacterium]|nr:methyltransferase domain-containing protein [Verrucomicrobiota bacterium]MDA1068634.1 methyltransferase domain-containing protein [Verrucomicrobiota bacterium]
METFFVNVGCGNHPTDGYLNFDGSPSVRLANWPLLARALKTIGLLDHNQIEFIRWLRGSGVRFANVSKCIPLPDESVKVLYSSHMVEHLTKPALIRYFAEAKRVLTKDGVMRTVFPDISRQVQHYSQHRDCDRFIENLKLAEIHKRLDSFRGIIQVLVFGDPGHKWMYDAESFARLLAIHGYRDIKICKSGETHIEEVGALNLCERDEESAYVEACK